MDGIKQGLLVKTPLKWVLTHKGLALPSQPMPDKWMELLLPKVTPILEEEFKAPSPNGSISVKELPDGSKAGLYKWLDVKSNPRDGIFGLILENGSRIEITSKEIIVLSVKDGQGVQTAAPLPLELVPKLASIFQRSPNKYKGSKVSKEVSTGELEIDAKAKGIRYVAGVDESGRGNFAGPLSAAAVMVDTQNINPELEAVKDCKALSHDELAQLYAVIEPKLMYGVGHVSADELNKMDDLDLANQLAFQRALADLEAKTGITPDLILLDGTSIKLPESKVPVTQHAQGEGKSTAIAAASVIAKFTHDEIMHEMHFKYPAYQFNQHKGAGTKTHQAALEKYGPCPEHRIHFAPIRKLIKSREQGELAL